MDHPAGFPLNMPHPLPWQTDQAERLRRAHTASRLPHAILLSGVAGLGKRRFCDWLAARLLCEAAAERAPCGECRGCRLLAGGSHPDLLRVGLEEGKRQLGIDAVRGLIGFVRLSSQYAGYRVALVHQADHMNRSSANSLLKTLEEPPANAVLVLVADQPARLPATIRSRCQQVAFAAPTPRQAKDWLQAQEASAAESLLPLCGFAPLAAIALLQRDAASLQDRLTGQLAGLASGELTVHAAADAWPSDDLALMLDLLIVNCQRLLRDATIGGIPELDHALRGLPLEPDASYGYLDYLYRTRALNDRALQPRLLVEDLLIRWQALFPEGRPPDSPKLGRTQRQ